MPLVMEVGNVNLTIIKIINTVADCLQMQLLTI